MQVSAEEHILMEIKSVFLDVFIARKSPFKNFLGILDITLIPAEKYNGKKQCY